MCALKFSPHLKSFTPNRFRSSDTNLLIFSDNTISFSPHHLIEKQFNKQLIRRLVLINMDMDIMDADSIQPVRGTAFARNELIVDTPAATNFGKHHPIQDQWPPAYLGFVPNPHEDPLQIPGVQNVNTCTISGAISSSDGLVNQPGTNPLLAIWSATRQRIGNFDYLVLPPVAPRQGNTGDWVDSHHPGYPSNRIMVRKSYEKAFSIFLQETARLFRVGCHLALGGTSGLGKTFCYRYIIWRLLHPDGIEVHSIPETIFLWTNPKDPKGFLYHKGSFYAIISMATFLATSAAENMFGNQDAWMICDGAPPTTYMACPIVVSSSPANFQTNDITDAKKFFKTSNCRVYLPPWTAEEVWAAARDVYGLTDADEGKLLERFTMFGGIARSIFLNFKDTNQVMEDLFVVTDVTTAINEVGSTELNHQKVSGMILHLIPDNTLTKFTYQWASTAIMEAAFAKMFSVSKNKIQTFLHAGVGLHLGIFYGLLFEPYFHARVCEQGYTGRIRQLTPATNDHAMIPTIKRKWYRATKLVTEPHNHEIPVQQLNHFHTHNQIKANCYNVPDRKNFAAVDAITPSIGEMYQVTSAESHLIKGIHLRPLKKFFTDHLATGQHVKLIFVVPPNRFDAYTEQQYIFPARKTNNTGKGKEKGEQQGKEKDDEIKSSKANAKDDYDLAPWDEDEAEDNGHDEIIDKAKLLHEVTSWVEQWVMEVNVGPLLKTVDKRVESSVKKSFIKEWGRSKKEETETE